MAETTITEALAELKLIDKKIEKKSQFIMNYIVRQAAARDPLEKNGGSPKAIAEERQAIGDLQQNKIAIRRAIQAANASTDLTINGTTRSIADWLVWRRDSAPKDKQILGNIASSIRGARDHAIKKGAQFATQQPETFTSADDLVVNVDEMDVAKQAELIEDTLGKLDGLLSLKNATVTISY